MSVEGHLVSTEVHQNTENACVIIYMNTYSIKWKMLLDGNEMSMEVPLNTEPDYVQHGDTIMCLQNVGKYSVQHDY